MTTTHVRLHYADTLQPLFSIPAEPVPRTVVWEGDVDHDEEASPAWVAEVAYDQFQRVGEGHYENPALDAGGLRSMSVGDVVEIVGLGASTFWVARSVGFDRLSCP